jgi:hypothetical protein
MKNTNKLDRLEATLGVVRKLRHIFKVWWVYEFVTVRTKILCFFGKFLRRGEGSGVEKSFFNVT